VKQIR